MSYDTDYVAWAQQQAALLRSHRFGDLDLELLAQEIEDLPKSEQRAIRNQLVRLMMHLLKWRYQPQRRGESWIDSVQDARTQIEGVIEENPSLWAYPAAQVEACYPKARRIAARQTKLPLATFPEVCPWARDEVLDEDFLPEATP